MSPAALGVAGLALAAVAALGGCHCFRDERQLANFRVLGVELAPASPQAGDTVTLTLATADVRPRAVAVQWHRCPGELDLYSISDRDAGVATVDDCLREAPFGTGTTVTLRLPDEVPDRGRFQRVAADVVGFACAGGTIGPPTERDTFPTCHGADAQGFVFRRRITVCPSCDPGADLAITEVRFGLPGQTAPMDPRDPPRVPRCTAPESDDPQCTRYRVEVATTLESSFVSVDYVVDRASLTHVRTDSYSSYRSRCPGLPQPDREGGFAWMPPREPGEARFFLLVRDGDNRFAWTERRVIVE